MKLRKGKDFLRNRRKILLFLGTGHGVGLTTFALSLSNYLSSYERKRVCYIEISDRMEAVTMDFDESIVKGDTVGYLLNGLDIYPNAKKTDISCIRKMEYDFLVIDAGVVDAENIPFREFDRAFIVGSLLPWKRKNYYSFINNLSENRKDMLQEQFFTSALTQKEKKEFYKKFGLVVNDLPLLRDPFKLSKDDVSFFSKVLV